MNALVSVLMKLTTLMQVIKESLAQFRIKNGEKRIDKEIAEKDDTKTKNELEKIL